MPYLKNILESKLMGVFTPNILIDWVQLSTKSATFVIFSAGKVCFHSTLRQTTQAN